MAAFDPAEYETMTLEGANEVAFTPIPDGEYKALVDAVKLDKITTKNGESLVLRVTWDLFEAGEELKKALNKDKITIRQDIFIDLNEQGGVAFGPNQNVRLGQLRQELGMNDPKKKFAFKMLEGAGPAKIKVTHQDATDGSGKVYNNVGLILSRK